MNGKNVFTFLLFAICIGGGIQHWFSRKDPIPTTPPAEQASTATTKVAGGTTAPNKAVAPTTPAAPMQPALEPHSAPKHIYELIETHSLEQSLELGTALVIQLEPHARTQSDNLGYAYLARGEVYEALKRSEDAIADYEHVYYLWRDDTPDSGRGWLRVYDALTRAYTGAGRWTETLTMAERGLKTAAATPIEDRGIELHFHERKIDALVALNRTAAAEAAADALKKRLPELMNNHPSLRARWLGWLAERYTKLGLEEKRRACLASAASDLPEATIPPSTFQGFEDAMAMARAALAGGNRTEANRRADLLLSSLRTFPTTDDTLKASLAMCRFYDDAERYKEGLALAKATLEIHAKAKQSDPDMLRKILRWLYSFNNSLCDFDEAAGINEKILELDRKQYGENSEQYIRDLRARAHILFFTGNSADALICARDTLARADRLAPSDESLVESCLGTIGFIITQSNEASSTEAEAALRRAIEINEKLKGKLHPSSASYRINLATALLDQKRLDDAQTALTHGFACLKANNELDSDLAGWGYCMLSTLHEAKKEWSEALAAAGRGVEIRERIYGLQNFRTRIMLRQYVSVAWEAGERRGCVERAEQLLASALNDHGWSEQRDLQLCLQLAKWQRELGNDKRAQELFALVELHSKKGNQL